MRKKWQPGVFYKVRLEDGRWYRLTKQEACDLLNKMHVTSSFIEVSCWEEWYQYPHISTATEIKVS